ncbi:MAG: SlyX family protein [Pseudomonadota bacterium]
MSDEPVTRSEMIELQTKMAFIEDTMRSVDLRMHEQQKHIEKLEKWCQTLAQRMREQSANGAGDDGHEVPPHY